VATEKTVQPIGYTVKVGAQVYGDLSDHRKLFTFNRKKRMREKKGKIVEKRKENQVHCEC